MHAGQRISFRMFVVVTVAWVSLLEVRSSLAYLTFGDQFYGGSRSKWGEAAFGTGATVRWGYMADGTAATAIDGVMGGSAITQLRSGFDAAYGAGQFDAAIDRALATWSAAANINFIYSPTDTGLSVNDPGAGLPEIRIGAFNPVPGSGFSFVGGAGFAPPPNGGTLEGDILLNSAIGFQIAPGAEDVTAIDFSHGNDLEGLVLHEIGHALGLAHPDPADLHTLADDVMLIHTDGSPYLVNRQLSADDLAGIRHIYGLRDPLKGDLNVDGKVTPEDVQSLLSALADLPDWKLTNGISENDLVAIADLNGDHGISNADLQSLLNYLKGGAGGNSATVPEPAGWQLLATAVAALVVYWNWPPRGRGD